MHYKNIENNYFVKLLSVTTSERRMILILFKSRLWHGCFPIDFVKLLRTPFLEITSGRLLLSFVEVWPSVGLGAIVLQFLKNSSSVFFKGLRVGVWAVGVCYVFLVILHWVGWVIGLWLVRWLALFRVRVFRLCLSRRGCAGFAFRGLSCW